MQNAFATFPGRMKFFFWSLAIVSVHSFLEARAEPRLKKQNRSAKRQERKDIKVIESLAIRDVVSSITDRNRLETKKRARKNRLLQSARSFSPDKDRVSEPSAKQTSHEILQNYLASLSGVNRPKTTSGSQLPAYSNIDESKLDAKKAQDKNESVHHGHSSSSWGDMGWGGSDVDKEDSTLKSVVFAKKAQCSSAQMEEVSTRAVSESVSRKLLTTDSTDVPAIRVHPTKSSPLLNTTTIDIAYSDTLRNAPPKVCTFENTWMNYANSGHVVWDCPQDAMRPEILVAHLKLDSCIDGAEVDKQLSFAGIPPSATNYEYAHRTVTSTSESASSASSKKSFPEADPSDNFYSMQWHLKNNRVSTRCPAIWPTTIGGENTDAEQPQNVIGVIDTSFFIEHPDLKNKWYRNTSEICGNLKDDDNNGLVDDCHGWNFHDNTNNLLLSLPGNTAPGDPFVWHGTAVAGSAAAETDNSLGIAAPCPNCRILPIATGLFISQVLLGINYIISQGVKIINFSFGGSESQALSTAMKLLEKEVLFVVSAGNSSCDVGTPVCKAGSFPGSSRSTLKNVISVGSYKETGAASSFSNFGKFVSVYAPGEIVSTVNNFTQAFYAAVRGTSFASPVTAGLAALLRLENPSKSPEEIRDCFESTCKRSSLLKGKSICDGHVDIRKAFNKCFPK